MRSTLGWLANAATSTSRNATSETVAATTARSAADTAFPCTHRRTSASTGTTPDVEVELGDVPEEPSRHGPDVVRRVRRRGVGAEQRREAAAAGELREHDEGREPAEHRVEQREARSCRAPSCERGDQEQARPAPPAAARPPGRASRTRARARRGRAARCGAAALEQRHEREREQQEERIERVLGHQRAGVEHRRHRDGERGDDERAAPGDDAAREQVRGTAASDISSALIALIAL